MRPLRLELEGFGAFRDACTVDFTDIELVALVGNTGAGKSTIIDAITFALYGSVARYADNRAVAPVINQTSTRARVRLDFELGDDRYTAVRLVQRTRNGATTKEARLERGDEVLAADARSMSAEISRLLGLDVDQFNRTVVLPQGRFADFLHDSPGRPPVDVAPAARTGDLPARRGHRPPAGGRAAQPDRRPATGARRGRPRARRRPPNRTRRAPRPGGHDADGVHRGARPPRGPRRRARRARRPAGRRRRSPGAARRGPSAGRTGRPGRPGEDADAEVERAAAALATARDRRRSAEAAAAAGPDLATCTTQLRLRHDAEQAAGELAATTDRAGRRRGRPAPSPRSTPTP